MADYIVRWPRMWWRLIAWLLWIKMPRGPHRLPRWLAGVIMLVIDLTTFGLWYMTLMDLLKWNTRPLQKTERDMAASIFGDSLPYQLITIDDRSWVAKQGHLMAYVSLMTVNYSRTIADPILIHELVHVWQYRHMGSAYITEALFAQKWGSGYNYGGEEALQKHVSGSGLMAFNPEQQADIIEDYFRWTQGLPMKWMKATPLAGALLEAYSRPLVRKP